MSELSQQFELKRYGVTPLVSFDLKPEGRIIAHPGSVIEMSPDVEMTVSFISRADVDSGKSTVWGWAQKAFVAQGVTAEFRNKSAEVSADVTLHPPGGGCVAWLDLSETGTITCRLGDFLAATNDVIFGVKKVAPFILGNQDSFMETISVPPNASADMDHHIFIESTGVIAERTLQEGEVRLLHYDTLLAATESVDISVEKIQSTAARWFGGEGRYFTKLTGPGSYWIQTSNTTSASGTGPSGISMEIPALA